MSFPFSSIVASPQKMSAAPKSILPIICLNIKLMPIRFLTGPIALLQHLPVLFNDSTSPVGIISKRNLHIALGEMLVAKIGLFSYFTKNLCVFVDIKNH